MRRNNRSFYFFDLLKEYLDEFLPKVRNCTPKTIETYRQSFKSLVQFFKEQKHISFDKLNFTKISYGEISDFLKWLRMTKQASGATANLRLSAIRSFLKYCADKDPGLISSYLDVNKIVKVKSDKRKRIEYLTSEQLSILFAQPDTGTKQGRRDRFFLIFLYQTGVRLQEVIDLTYGNIITAGSSVKIRVFGKGRKERHVPVLKEAEAHLNAYLAEFHTERDPDKPLFFIQHRHGTTKMSPGAINAMLRKYTDSAKNKCPDFPNHIHPHMLRHSIAMEMFRNGVPLSHIRDFLGHSSLQSTYVYAYSDDSVLLEAMSKVANVTGKIPIEKVEERIAEEQELLRYCGLA